MTWSQTLVVTWVQFVVAAAALLLVARIALLRVVQPVDRIRLIQCTMVAVLVIPVFITLAPWRVRLIAPVGGSVAETSPDSTLHSGVHDPFPATTFSPGPFEAGDRPRVSPNPPVGSYSAQDEQVTRAEESSGVAAVFSLGRRPDIFNAWAVAALALAVFHGVAFGWFLVEWGNGAARLRRLIHTASPAPQAVHDAWKAVTQGRGPRVRLLISPEIESPLTFGWRRPIVILPRETVSDGPALGFCLAHEWTHIERADILSWHGLFACQIILWYQPLFWTLRRELRLCQDLLADDRSAPAGDDAIEYSDLLVSFAKKRLTGPLAGALTFLDHPSQLMRRVKMLLQRQVAVRAQCTWKFSLAALLLALLSAGAISAVRLDVARAHEADQQPAAEAAVKPEIAGQVGGAKNEPAVAKDQAAASKGKPAEPKDRPAEQPVRLSYTGTVLDKGTGKGIPNATVVVRRSNLTSRENRIVEETKHKTDVAGKYSFEIPAEQVAMRFLYIELDVDHENYAARKGFGYALSMIRKNEDLGERPFFERVELDASEPVTGTVLSPEGKPLSGVMLRGYSKANPGDFRDYGSFTDTLTTPEGKFRLNLVKGGEGVVWILPKDYAIVQKLVGKQRGDLGDFRLQPGVRVTGRVLNVAGKPIPGVAVNISSQSQEDLGGLNVSSSVCRGAISDEDGRITFAPLPGGDYRIIPEEHLRNPCLHDRTIYPVPGVFLAQKVTLKEGATIAPLAIQAAPHVVFHAQYYDAKGAKTTGHELMLFGQMDGEHWFGQGRPDAQGTIALRVPHGLQKVQVQLMTNEHGALRYRLGLGKPLQNKQRNIEFGTLNDDVEGFEIVRYRAPIMLIKAVDDEGRLIKGFQVSATYPLGKQEYVLEGERRSDISFECQDDGRYRTSQMLPDEEVIFTAVAAGYQPVSEKRKLTEGESQELVLTLKKAAEKKQE